MERARGLISTRDAAAKLGVKVETLYAYVSRGLIVAHQVDGERGSFYDPAEVAALAQKGRATEKRQPLTIESSITLIEAGNYWYRGHDPRALSGTATFEQVAELLWGATDWSVRDRRWRADPEAANAARAAVDSLPVETPPFDRLRVAASVIAAMDLLRFDLSASTTAATTRRLVATLIDALGAASSAAEGPIAERLLTALRPQPPSRAEVDGLNAALILLADHEIAASTLSVRTAAAFKADPHAAISAGFGALAGAWHGGATAAAEELLRECVGQGNAERAVARRVRDGQPIPGLGQPLYPDGDPRAPALFTAARRAAPASAVHGALDQLILLTEERGFPLPNCDLGLAAIAVGLDLEPGSSEAIFAIARITGWVAHAMEEYAQPSNLRPRAVYVGERP